MASLESRALFTQMLSNTQINIFCEQTATIGLPRKLWESATVPVSWCPLKWRRCWAALFRRPPRTRSVRWPLPPLPPQRRLPAPCARPRSSSDACRRIWETVRKEKANSWVFLSLFVNQTIVTAHSHKDWALTCSYFLVDDLVGYWWERATSPNAHKNSSAVEVNLRHN